MYLVIKGFKVPLKEGN